MSVEQMVRVITGSIIVVSLLFGASGSPLYLTSYFLWLPLLLGVDLIQSAFTGYCPVEDFIKQQLAEKKPESEADKKKE
jgi:hypothetical protein